MIVRVVSERQGGERGVARLHNCDFAERRLQGAHGGERAAVVGQGDLQHAGGGAEGGERLAGAEHVDQAAADRRVAAERSGGDDAVLVGEQKAAAVGGRPGRQRPRQQFLRVGDGAIVMRERRLQALGGDVGDRIEGDHHVGQGLPPMLELVARRRRRRWWPERR